MAPLPMGKGAAAIMQLDMCCAAEEDTCYGVRCSECMFSIGNLPAFRAYMVRGMGEKGGE